MGTIKQHIRTLRASLAEWRWLGGYMKRYRGAMAFYLILGLVGVAMGLLCSLAQKDLINAVTAAAGIGAAGSNTAGTGAIATAAVWAITLAVGQILLGAVGSWVSTRINIRVVSEIRADIFRRLLAARWEALAAYHSGDLISRLEGDVGTVAGGVVGFVPTLITRAAQFGGAFGIILWYDPTMALLALISAPILLLSGRPLLRVLRTHNERMRDVNGRILSFNSEVFRGIGAVKAFDLGATYCGRLHDLQEEYRAIRLSHNRVSVAMSVVMGLLGLIAGYGCYAWGVWRLYVGAIDYGEMTLFLSLSGTLSGAFSGLVGLVPSAVSVATATGRVMEVVNLPAEPAVDEPAAAHLLAAARRGGVRVRADRLTFAYAGGEGETLAGVSFDLAPGEMIALVGPSGGGKTTLLRLLLGLVTPTAGTLTVTDAAGRHRMPLGAGTRRLCAYVPQGNAIFAGTVADNLRAVAPDAPDEALWDALRLAAAEDFVTALPAGLDTPLGEGGTGLSEGQLQRLAIARALLRGAPLLILDEATSALDPATEAQVLEGLMSADPRRICILTTHRAGALGYADRVLEIRDGRVIEDSAHVRREA